MICPYENANANDFKTSLWSPSALKGGGPRQGKSPFSIAFLDPA
jgi:hypothetical protein